MKNSIQPYLSNLNDVNINPQLVHLNKAFPQNASTDSIRKNIVTFNIFYNDLRYNLYSGVEQYNWFTLMANLAGTCGGSFLGISFLAILEFFEYILYSIFILFKFCFIYINKNISN